MELTDFYLWKIGREEYRRRGAQAGAQNAAWFLRCYLHGAPERSEVNLSYTKPPFGRARTHELGFGENIQWADKVFENSQHKYEYI